MERKDRCMMKVVLIATMLVLVAAGVEAQSSVLGQTPIGEYDGYSFPEKAHYVSGALEVITSVGLLCPGQFTVAEIVAALSYNTTFRPAGSATPFSVVLFKALAARGCDMPSSKGKPNS